MYHRSVAGLQWSLPLELGMVEMLMGWEGGGDEGEDLFPFMFGKGGWGCSILLLQLWSTP